MVDSPKLYRIDTKKAHVRYKNAAGKRLPGVTTVLDNEAKPHLVKWANNLGLDGIDSTKFVDEAAIIGTIGHALCECHVKGMELDHSNISPELLNTAETTYIKFLSWWDREKFDLIESELAVVSEAMQVGGTVDILAYDRDGLRVLIDMKTSKSIYPNHLVQASAYAAIYEEQTGLAIDRVLICRIGKEDKGDFEVREIYNRDECLAHFKALRAVHETAKKIKY